ncbi:MAG: ADP-ribosylglycohydrolase family protein [Chthonomonadales bacterium]|nr:ADP-ribosylglycohydrolase family protein [Chthonomonadales bacterium]
MAVLAMSPESYADRVHGAWMGRSIGVTLGVPRQGATGISALRFYEPAPGQPAASEALDFQLAWLQAVRECGPGVGARDLVRARTAHLRYVDGAYGHAARNLRRGLGPPLSGAFDNWYRGSHSAAERATLWGLLAPGAPQVAATYAHMDASVDHAEEGVWTAMFWAALTSAAFFVSEPGRLMAVGLAMVPEGSRVARGARLVRDSALPGASWLDARNAALSALSPLDEGDAPLNTAFALAGWLFGGGDFGRALCGAVNCGYGTAGTGAILGTVLGVLVGRTGIPAAWAEPIGEGVVLGWGLHDLAAPRTNAQLTELTCTLAAQVLADRCPEVALRGEEPNAAAPPSGSAGLGTPEPGPPEPAAGAGALAESTSPGSAGAEPASGALAEAPAPPASPAEPPAAPVSPAPQAPPAVDWTANDSVKPLLARPAMSMREAAGPFGVVADFGETGPSLVPGVAAGFTAAVRNEGADDFYGSVTVCTPAGWQVAVPAAQGQRQAVVAGGRARFGFVVRAPESERLGVSTRLMLSMTPEAGPSGSCDLRMLSGACWWVVGPFRNLSGEGFDRAYEVEDRPERDAQYLGRGSVMVGWQKLAVHGYVVPIEPVFGDLAGVAYLATTLRMPAAMEARLLARTNDGLVMWVNGRRVHHVHAHDPFRPDLSLAGAPVSLNAGENHVLLKVVRCERPAALAFCVADAAGVPLEDQGNTGW